MVDDREFLLDLNEPEFIQEKLEAFQRDWENQNDRLWGSLPTWQQNELIAKAISNIVQEYFVELNNQMTNGYNLKNGDDCRELIMQFNDGYVPYQIEDFPKNVVDMAIESIKEDGLELSGNMIYQRCVDYCNLELSRGLEDLKRELQDGYDDPFKEVELKIVKNFLETSKCDSLLWCYANGSLDSSIYLNQNLSDNELHALQIIDKRTAIFESFEESTNCDINFEFRDMEFEQEQERE